LYIIPLLTICFSFCFRFEIELESARVAFKSILTATSGTSSINVTISDVELHMDAYTLTDSVTRVLNETAATSGLEIPFVTYGHVQDSVKQGSNNFEVRKAVSRSLSVITKLSTNDNVAGEEYQDSMASSIFNVESFQTRVGSLYFPNQPISGANRDRTITECYLHANHAFGKLKASSAPSSIGIKEYRDDLACLVTTLERSNALQLTGVPVNASRVCENRVNVGPDTVTAQTAANQVCDSWLCYVRLIRVFINSLEVEE
jgi:hypothetical protein